MKFKIGMKVKSTNNCCYNYTNTCRYNWIGKVVQIDKKENEIKVETIKSDYTDDIGRQHWVDNVYMTPVKEVMNK